MSSLKKLREEKNPVLRNILLRDAILEKINQLKKDLEKYPGVFFMLPGVASRKDKEDKIKALEQLQIRFSLGHEYVTNTKAYKANILDGETLELFKFSAEIYDKKFKDEELANLTKRNPSCRLLRRTTG